MLSLLVVAYLLVGAWISGWCSRDEFRNEPFGTKVAAAVAFTVAWLPLIFGMLVYEHRQRGRSGS